MQVDLFITTFQRPKLLATCLESIARHSWLRIVVLDEGFDQETVDVCREAGVERRHTGSSKESETHWRIPGFALNMGIKQSNAEIIIISAEMFHRNDCCQQLVDAVIYDPLALAIPVGYDQQRDGKLIPLNTKLHFLIALRREHFMAIGGYDEDFVGACYDDNDLVDRLCDYGCHYVQTMANCIHLWHDRNTTNKRARGRIALNKRLYEERKGQIYRNLDRPWGV